MKLFIEKEVINVNKTNNDKLGKYVLYCKLRCIYNISKNNLQKSYITRGNYE